MGRRKQFVPRKSDNKGEDQENQSSDNEDEGNAESDGGSESNDDQELTKPIEEPLEPGGLSPAYEKMQPETMDLLKNPFLLPAQLMALNPNLYAAQLAQLQAAQLLFAKQQEENTGRNGDHSRKRSIDDDGPLDLGPKPKYQRSSPNEKSSEPGSESPLDLSGNKSPELKRDLNSFNHLTPHGLLSFFSQIKPPTSSPQDIPSLMGFPPKVSPPSPGPPSRHSTWQSQWVNKGSENTKAEDVFKCVWCRESYQSLDALTTHMKEAKHHSMSYQVPHSSSLRPPVTSPIRSSVSMSSPIPSMASPPKPPMRDILKEQLPLPRKLVRGQDVWIGRADQQTRDILKCMGCGQSFRSLELLTKHMQETQHYKKVISHDQISAWRYPESQPSTKSNVNSVLTCKVCDKGHNSLKELSDHVIKANHYSGESKQVRSVVPTHSPSPLAAKERKKALPVKKLLELERARQEVVCGATGSKAANSAREIMESGKLYCERCENKIPLDVFINHIQKCVGKPRFIPTSLPKMDSISSKDASTQNCENDKKTDGNSSILGSLEQLVKGNFQNSGPKRLPVSSPPTTTLNPPTSMGKFSIQSMFPKEPVPSPSPSNSVTSKPASPSSSRPSSTGHPSLEKMLDSPIEHTNGKIKEETDMERETSPSPTSSHNGSPPLDDCLKDNIKIKHDESQDIKHNIKNEIPLGSKSPITDEDTKSKNPLAALQMLCDTQKKIPKPHKIQENTTSDPGAMLAFSWACNQAVSNDSVIKCPFCDTPFISKGAYRHHLSKMHFQKDSCVVPRSETPTNIGLSAVRTPSPVAKEDSTLQSKYHKYAQLAKQLSCNQK